MCQIYILYDRANHVAIEIWRFFSKGGNQFTGYLCVIPAVQGKLCSQKQKALAITSFSSNCKGSKSVTHKQNKCHAVLPNRLNN